MRLISRGHAATLCVLAIGAALPASALADRAGSAPLDAPHISSSRHVAFTLHGSGWAQVVGATEATPALGTYALALPAPTGCVVTAHVRATATHGRPSVRGHTVQVRPPIRLKDNRLVYTKHGRHGPITWWLGRRDGYDLAVAGVQRAPRSIARHGTPWILYEASLDRQSQSSAGDGACPKAARAAESAIALAIARSMHLAGGPTTATAPFSTA